MNRHKAQVINSKLDRRSPVRYLKGVGPEKEKLLARLGIETLGQLLLHFPRAHQKRFPVLSPKNLTFDGKECVIGQVARRQAFRYKNGLSVFKAVLENGASEILAVFHHQAYLTQVFEPGKYAVLYGQAERTGNKIQMMHPEYVIMEKPLSKTPHHGGWIPVYALTEDLSQKKLRQLMYEALTHHAEAVTETLSDELRRKHGFVGRAEAIQQYHFPDSQERMAEARRRLVFDEFFDFQMKIEEVRRRLKTTRPGLRHSKEKISMRPFYEALPFKPTASQERAVAEILSDLSSESTMNRLLQGDVGSGKTLVASAASFFAAKNSFQSLVMAPTEILSQQLFAHFKRFLEPHGIRISYLAQGVPEAERGVVLDWLAKGEIDVLIGTHALLEKEVRCKNLGLVIVDEQHKFGVSQRSFLRNKSGPCHFLSMTATPIPRSLAMTLYGDVDLSTLSDGIRQPDQVSTAFFGSADREAIYAWMREILAGGGKGFVVCPALRERVEQMRSAEKVHQEISRKFADFSVSLLHGQMKSDEKKKIMETFRASKAGILVSTVIIEVGVDVPDANLIVVENAERFGLAQLHQLRGRVGRSPAGGRSYCVLISDTTEEASRERLEFFVRAKSGFQIAEKDLEMRGAGEWFGHKQHGVPEFKLGDMVKDLDIMRLAQEEAKRSPGAGGVRISRVKASEAAG